MHENKENVLEKIRTVGKTVGLIPLIENNNNNKTCVLKQDS